ncbi:CDP-2,3-bis-(O-geranylgeranyl)-sn-glycerol synthase [Thermococci archaeon]|nr:MAG: CDP-2,3-bis-(O-geranylgeranyl)-sn-glycerol synthase [Thermococci archaeon]
MGGVIMGPSDALLFILPAYIANATPVVTGGGKPMDFEMTFIDGRRILGKGKTWRGFFSGILSGTILGLLIWELLEFEEKSITLAILLSLGALVGDCTGSFIKRRLNIERGRPLPLVDQLDFLLGALVFSEIVTDLPIEAIIFLVVITPVIHLGFNVLAYLLGLKNTWY